MSLRLSDCSTMPCQVFSGEAVSCEAFSCATAILPSPLKPAAILRFDTAPPRAAAPKLDAADGIVNMPHRYRDLQSWRCRKRADMQQCEITRRSGGVSWEVGSGW